MVNGLPGNMATAVAQAVIQSEDFELLPVSFSGIASAGTYEGLQFPIRLIDPASKRHFTETDLVLREEQFLTVDYTLPAAINANGEFYADYSLPFVMGTSGGDRLALEAAVENSNTVAVIAPNMAKQIVAFQGMMEYAAQTFPNAFKDYSLEIIESHQQGKADTSGTAKAMVGYFNTLGVPFSPSQIKMIRDEPEQSKIGVPEDALRGHGWHTYTLKSENKDVLVLFRHNVNGRKAYADGTIDALRFLNKKVEQNESGKVYSMIDVLKGV